MAKQATERRHVRPRLGPEAADGGRDEPVAELRRHVLHRLRARTPRSGWRRRAAGAEAHPRRWPTSTSRIDPVTLTQSGADIAARLLRRQVRDGRRRQLHRAADRRAGAEGVPLDGAAAADGQRRHHQAADPQTPVGVQAEQARRAGRGVHRLLRAAPTNLAAVAEGDWLIPASSSRDAIRCTPTGGKNGWAQILPTRSAADRRAVPASRRTTRRWKTEIATPALQQYFAGRSTLTDSKQKLIDGWQSEADDSGAGPETTSGPAARAAQLRMPERRRNRESAGDKAVGALAGAAVGDALGGATEGCTPEQIRQRHGGWVTGIVGAVQRRLARRPADRAVPQGRRPRHRRHPDDSRAGRGVRQAAHAPGRLRHGRAIWCRC